MVGDQHERSFSRQVLASLDPQPVVDFEIRPDESTPQELGQ
jgi:hypothetical protein